MLALAVTLAFVVVELAGGWLANSLVLLTDAAHNFSDAFALGLSWWALRLSIRPANNHHTYGYHRAGILVALANAATLLALSLWIVYEAVGRLRAPPEVQEQLIVLVGALGFMLNAGIAWSLHGAGRSDVNVRSAFVHMAGDALATLGVVAAGIGIALFGWRWLDPLVSLLIAALIVWSTAGLLRETLRILLEGTPRDVDLQALVCDMRGIKGVRGVHDLHVWSISSNLRALSAHVLTDDMTLAEGARVQRELNALLRHAYGIGHTALQLECSGCDPDGLFCELTPAPERER